MLEWRTRWTEKVRTMYNLNVYRWPLILRLHNVLQKKTAEPAAEQSRTAMPTEWARKRVRAEARAGVQPHPASRRRVTRLTEPLNADHMTPANNDYGMLCN